MVEMTPTGWRRWLGQNLAHRTHLRAGHPGGARSVAAAAGLRAPTHGHPRGTQRTLCSSCGLLPRAKRTSWALASGDRGDLQGKGRSTQRALKHRVDQILRSNDHGLRDTSARANARPPLLSEAAEPSRHRPYPGDDNRAGNGSNRTSCAARAVLPAIAERWRANK